MLKKCTTLSETNVTEEEFNEAFKSFKRYKTPGSHSSHVNLITSVYKFVKMPLIKIFNDSINFGIFPENMKIAKVTVIFKSGKAELLTNFRPISALSFFSKILGWVMYNRLYKYSGESNLVFEK